jgi:hypothetical protein
MIDPAKEIPLPGIPEQKTAKMIDFFIRGCKRFALLEKMVDGKKYYRCKRHGVLISEEKQEEKEQEKQNENKY